MKSKILPATALFLFFCTWAYSQNSRLSYGISVAPKLVLLNGHDEDLVNSKDEWGYAVNVEGYYDFSNKMQVKSGLGFNKIKVTNRDYSVLLGCDNINGSADIFNSYFENQISLYYLSIPLEVKFKFNEAANHFYFIGGIETFIRVKLDSKSVLYECQLVGRETDQNFYTTNTILNSLKLGGGVEFKISSILKGFFEPEIKYTLNKVFTRRAFFSEPLAANGHLFMIGAKVGIRFVKTDG